MVLSVKTVVVDLSTRLYVDVLSALAYLPVALALVVCAPVTRPSQTWALRCCHPVLTKVFVGAAETPQRLVT